MHIYIIDNPQEPYWSYWFEKREKIYIYKIYKKADMI